MPIAAVLPPLEAWVAVFGRLHPLVLHAPIGLLSALALLEVWLFLRRRRPDPGEPTGMRWVGVERAIGLLAWASAFSALLTAGAGLVLAQEDGYAGGQTLECHRNLGLAVAAGALLLGLTHGRPKLLLVYRALIAITLGLLGPAGHFGAEMTHGAGFLTEPLREHAARPPKASPTRDTAPAASLVTAGGAAATATGAAATAGGATGAATPSASASTDASQGSDPLANANSNAGSSSAAAPSYNERIKPLFSMHCIACHGENKRKGGLSLTSPEGILKGGESGPILVAGDPAASDLVRRLRLPLEEDAHMPPDGKLQPTEKGLLLIEEWIRAGAPFDAKPASGAATPAAEPPAADGVQPAGDAQPGADAKPVSGNAALPPQAPAAHAAAPSAPAPSAAVDALRSALVHVQPRAAGSTLLWIDTAAIAPSVDDAHVRAWLEPLREHVAELSLARTRVSDASAALFASMPHLARLDLSATRVGPATLRGLAKAPALVELVLTRAHLETCNIDDLLGLRALKVLRVWNSAVPEAVLSALRAQRPDLEVDDGSGLLSKALETEPDLVLNGAAPLPGADAATATPTGVAANGVAPAGVAAADVAAANVPTAQPINAACPVSGAPVKAGFTVVFEGKLVGFCCANCPKTFAADPAKYAAKLP
jgi:uncharacterized membrane protein/YHS domain-containing protein